MAGEDRQGVMFISLNVSLKVGAGDARGRGRCVGRAARRARGQGRSGQGGLVGLPAAGGR